MADKYDYPSGSPIVDDAGRVSKAWDALFTRWQRVLSAIVDKGTTAQRPTTNLWIGRTFYDTTLGAPVYLQSYPPAVWVPFGGGAGNPALIAILYNNGSQASDRELFYNWYSVRETGDIPGVLLNLDGSFTFEESGYYEVTVHGTCTPKPTSGGCGPPTPNNWPYEQTLYGTKLFRVNATSPRIFERSQYARTGNDAYAQSDLNANAGTNLTTGDPQEQLWTDTFIVRITDTPEDIAVAMYVQNYNTSDFNFKARVSIKKLTVLPIEEEE